MHELFTSPQNKVFLPATSYSMHAKQGGALQERCGGHQEKTQPLLRIRGGPPARPRTRHAGRVLRRLLLLRPLIILILLYTKQLCSTRVGWCVWKGIYVYTLAYPGVPSLVVLVIRGYVPGYTPAEYASVEVCSTKHALEGYHA